MTYLTSSVTLRERFHNKNSLRGIMIRRIQQMPIWLRTLIYSLLIIIMALGVFIAFILLTFQSFNSTRRGLAVAIDQTITVSEFVTLPDDDAYPAALAITADGILYSGSYQSGVLWRITPEGGVAEVANTRQIIGSVSGLDVGPDGALYILDRIAPLTAEGAIVWRLNADDTLTLIVQFPKSEDAGGFDDIALDAQGRIYVSDRIRRAVWRFVGSGDPIVWWRSPQTPAEPIGLAYDALSATLLISDPTANRVYRVSVDAVDTATETVSVYDPAGRAESPGFDGITVAADGQIYAAALGTNRVGRVEANHFVPLAEGFRGASDVAWDSARRRLYVTNWNQLSLGFNTQPQLPFALDVIQLPPTP